MSDYPTSEELEEISELMDDVLGDPVTRKCLSVLQGTKQGYEELPRNFGGEYDINYGINQYKPTQEHFTFDRRYGLNSLPDMIVCRTSEPDIITGQLETISANPRDASHVLRAIENHCNSIPGNTPKEIGDRQRLKGMLKRFETTDDLSQISWRWGKEAMEKAYESRGFDADIVSQPSAKRASIKNGVINPSASGTALRSYGLAMGYDNFHQIYKENLLMQMNHRLTQEAIERNRTYFPDGNPLSVADQRGFTWDSFARVAKEAADDAFERTVNQIKLQQNVAAANKYIDGRSYNKKFRESLEPKIYNENIVEAFGREFKVHKGESQKDATKRIRHEYKDFANKKFDELKGKGMETILAQGLALRAGRTQVTAADVTSAVELFATARKNPVEFRTPERIIRQATGDKAELTTSLMRNLDGRSTFQRSHQTIERFGAHLHAHSESRTRIKAVDKEHGKAFAANTLLNVPPVKLPDGMSKAMKMSGYSVEAAVKTRAQMMKSVGQLKDDSGRVTDYGRIADKVAQKAIRQADAGVVETFKTEIKPTSSGQSDDNDNDPEKGPDGPTKGRSR